MRLDVFLAAHGFAGSRTEARGFIEAGAVYVAGRQVTKPAFDVTGHEEQVLLNRAVKKYVSRGGLKLEAALASFDIFVRDKLAMDIGASSGGFTDCLLQRGAAHVLAIDAGRGQLVPALRQDARVTVYESYNARYLRPTDLPYTPQLAVMDVSFISATYLLAPIAACLEECADFICLIKPQFEVGRAGLGKGGIVRDAALREGAIRRVLTEAQRVGLTPQGVIQSPIEGGDGNIEYLAHFQKNGS